MLPDAMRQIYGGQSFLPPPIYVRCLSKFVSFAGLIRLQFHRVHSGKHGGLSGARRWIHRDRGAGPHGRVSDATHVFSQNFCRQRFRYHFIWLTAAPSRQKTRSLGFIMRPSGAPIPFGETSCNLKNERIVFTELPSTTTPPSEFSLPCAGDW